MYNIKRRYKGEPVCPDPTVDPMENETGIYFTSADRSAWVSSYEPVVVERLLHHPNFKVEQLITMRIEEQECVVGVIGRLPIGAVRLGRATTKDSHELVVQVPGFRPAKASKRRPQQKSKANVRRPASKKPRRVKPTMTMRVSSKPKARPRKRRR